MDRNIPVPGRKPPVPLEFRLVDERLKDFIRKHEDETHYFYKDTKDNVTIGIGQMIPDLETAYTLPLYVFDGDKSLRLAHREEIEDSWKKVKSKPFGQHIPASKYDPRNHDNNLPNLGLRSPDREFLFEGSLRNSIRSLERKFPNIGSYPHGPFKALVDLEYNLGSKKFNREYIDPISKKNKGWPNLFDAVNEENWQKAADESHRELGKDNIRNPNTRDAFLEGLWHSRKR